MSTDALSIHLSPCAEAPGHLRLPAKCNDEFFPCMIEHIRDPKTQLEGIAMGTLHGDAKAHPQHGSGPVEPLPICFAH
jgi:hypothetical protein